MALKHKTYNLILVMIGKFCFTLRTWLSNNLIFDSITISKFPIACVNKLAAETNDFILNGAWNSLILRIMRMMLKIIH